jgi:hypothetical protein
VATNHDVWDAVAQSDGTPGNSFEFLIGIQIARSGPYIRTADITNVNPAFSGKKRARQTYGAKGVDLSVTYARNLVLTFDVEVVRDINGAFQPELQDLIDASKALGTDNRRRLQAYDALGADYAFQSDFSIEHARANTGWDDASFFTITAEQYTPTEWITNPVLVGNVPIITDARTIDGTVPGDGATIYITGDGFGGLSEATASNVKFDGVNATDFDVVNDELIIAILPAGDPGVIPVVVGGTTPSAEFLLIRGA